MITAPTLPNSSDSEKEPGTPDPDTCPTNPSRTRPNTLPSLKETRFTTKVRVSGPFGRITPKTMVRGRVLLFLLTILLSGLYLVGQNEDLDLPILPPEYAPTRSGNEPSETEAWQQMPDQGIVLPEPPPPVTFYGEEILGRAQTLIYVIDGSGSMTQPVPAYENLVGEVVTDGTRFTRAQTELIKSLRNLPANIMFNILVYECHSQAWAQDLASEDRRGDAISWVSDLRIYAGGLTGTVPSVIRAFEMARGGPQPGVVVLLTDGSPNCWPGGMQGNMQDMARFIDLANTDRIAVNVFGVGIYSDETRIFCQNVATDSGGYYFEVD